MELQPDIGSKLPAIMLQEDRGAEDFMLCRVDLLTVRKQSSNSFLIRRGTLTWSSTSSQKL